MKRTPVIIVQLVHMQGPLKGEIQELAESQISIGRQPSCHVCFPAKLTIISREHASIVREGNRFKLVDHSANGTFVNGKPVKEVYLKDVLEIFGKTRCIKYSLMKIRATSKVMICIFLTLLETLV